MPPRPTAWCKRPIVLRLTTRTRARRAEEALRGMERDVDDWQTRCDLIVELAADVERGLIDLDEFRDRADRIRHSSIRNKLGELLRV